MSGVRFIVMECCEEWEQPLGLHTGDGLPDGGVLDWHSECKRAHAFGTRAEARAAIKRTEHYRLAFGPGGPLGMLPEAKACRILAVTVP